MRKLTVLLLPAVLLTACGTKTASTGGQDGSAADSGTVFVSQGYNSAEDAYTAYMEAVLAGDYDAFAGIFSADEVKAAQTVPQDFVHDYYGYLDYADYREAVEESAFRNQSKEYLKTMQECIKQFGEEGDEWGYLPGVLVETDESVSDDFASALALDIADTELHEIFFLNDLTREASAAAKRVLLLEIDGKWYPSYTHECAGTM